MSELKSSIIDFADFIKQLNALLGLKSEEVNIISFLSAHAEFLEHPNFSYKSDYSHLRIKIDEIILRARDDKLRDYVSLYDASQCDELIQYSEQLNELSINENEKNALYELINNLLICKKNSPYLSLMERVKNDSEAYNSLFDDNMLFKHYLEKDSNNQQIEPRIINQIASFYKNDKEDIPTQIDHAINILFAAFDDPEIKHYDQTFALSKMLASRNDNAYTKEFIPFTVHINNSLETIKKRIISIQTKHLDLEDLKICLDKAKKSLKTQTASPHKILFKSTVNKIEKLYHTLISDNPPPAESNLQIRHFLKSNWYLTQQIPWNFATDNAIERVDFVTDLANLVVTDDEALVEIIMPQVDNIAANTSAETNAILALKEGSEENDDNGRRSLFLSLVYDEQTNTLLDAQDIFTRAAKRNDIFFSEQLIEDLILTNSQKNTLSTVYRTAYNMLQHRYLYSSDFSKKFDTLLNGIHIISASGKGKELAAAITDADAIKKITEFYDYWMSLSKPLKRELENIKCSNNVILKYNLYKIFLGVLTDHELDFTKSEQEKIENIFSCMNIMHGVLSIAKENFNSKIKKNAIDTQLKDLINLEEKKSLKMTTDPFFNLNLLLTLFIHSSSEHHEWERKVILITQEYQQNKQRIDTDFYQKIKKDITSPDSLFKLIESLTDYHKIRFVITLFQEELEKIPTEQRITYLSMLPSTHLVTILKITDYIRDYTLMSALYQNNNSHKETIQTLLFKNDYILKIAQKKSGF